MLRVRRLILVLVIVGTLSFEAAIGLPLWWAWPPAVIWGVHLVAVIAVAVWSDRREASTSTRVPSFSARQMMSWAVLGAVWVALGMSVGGIIIGANSLGEDVVSTPVIRLRHGSGGPATVTYQVDQSERTNSLEGFTNRGTRDRTPQTVVYDRQHPDRVMWLDQWQWGRSPWIAGAYLAGQGVLLFWFLRGSWRAVRTLWPPADR